MSAGELKTRLSAVLEKQITDYANRVLQVQRQAERIGQFAVSPSSRTEDIAMIVLEANAFRRGVEASLNALIEEHQKLVAPDTPPAEKSEVEGEDEPPY